MIVDMRFGIVEGEPGIFPDPITRLLRWLARPFRDRTTKDSGTPSTPDLGPVEGAPEDDTSPGSGPTPP